MSLDDLNNSRNLIIIVIILNLAYLIIKLFNFFIFKNVIYFFITLYHLKIKLFVNYHNITNILPYCERNENVCELCFID